MLYGSSAFEMKELDFRILNLYQPKCSIGEPAKNKIEISLQLPHNHSKITTIMMMMLMIIITIIISSGCLHSCILTTFSASPGSAVDKSRSIRGALDQSCYIWVCSLIFSPVISLTAAEPLEARTLRERHCHSHHRL